jgi:DNA polymerase III subunit delta'
MSVWDGIDISRPIAGLASQVSKGDVPHAWLFAGPSGSGKRPAAVAMAAALNCSVEPNVGCGRCSSCLRIARHRHPDVHHVVPEGPLIPVGTIREQVIPEAYRSPFEGARKVFVIEEAERMNPEAQNALLKTLEEPQPDTIFILISDRPEELLDTVRSRCRTIHLEPVPETRILELLAGEGAGPGDAMLAARLADGDIELARAFAFDEATRERRRLWLSIPRRLASPLDALDAAHEIAAEAKDAVKVRERAQKAEIEELAEAMGEGRGTATVRNALLKRHKRELRRLEEEVLGEALYCLGSLYRDVLAARRGGTEAIANTDVLDEIEAWGGSDVSDASLLRVIELCIGTRTALTTNANPALAIEATLVEAAMLVPASARVGADAD